MKAPTVTQIDIKRLPLSVTIAFLICIFLCSCDDLSAFKTLHDSDSQVTRYTQNLVMLTKNNSNASNLTSAEEIIRSLPLDEALSFNKDISDLDIASLLEIKIYPGFVSFDDSNNPSHDSDRNYDDANNKGVAIIMQVYFEMVQQELAAQVLHSLKKTYQQQATTYMRDKVALEIQGNKSLNIFNDPRLAKCINKALISLNTNDFLLIKELPCQDAEVDDLTGIGALSNLEVLYLQDNKFISLETLENLPSLKKMSIGRNSHLVSLKGIEKAKNSEEINLNLCSKLTDISAISTVKKLKKFIAMSARIRDISSFKNLHELELLILDRNKVSDIGSLSNKSKLVRLRLFHNPVKSFEPLLTNKNLKSLAVGGIESLHCATFIKLKKIMASGSTLIAPSACNIN